MATVVGLIYMKLLSCPGQGLEPSQRRWSAPANGLFDGRCWGMLRIVRILSFAAVAAAVWASALQLDLPPARRIAVLLVRYHAVPLHCTCTASHTLLSQPMFAVAGL